MLKNNNFILLGEMSSQAIDIAMGTKFATPSANLSVGILEETVLFSTELLKYFSHNNCKLIDEYLKDIW